MKRFSRDAAQMVADEPGWPRHRAPSEWKYFVLAAAALIGLGIGWWSGKAITGLLPAASPTMAVAERATPAANLSAADDVQETAASTDDDGIGENVAQFTNDEPARSERRAIRHPRRARGQFLFKPFKVFRKLKIW